MINFSVTPNVKKTPNAGRRPDKPELTAAQIKTEAARLLAEGISKDVWRVLDWLAVGGVMTVAQLQLNPRTLRKYAKARLVDRVPFPTREIMTVFEAEKIPVEDVSLIQMYVLGPLGLELLRGRHAFVPLTGYLNYPLSRVLHDVILNEIILRLVGFAESLGWETTWRGPNSARLVHPESKQEILEPDALLVFSKADQLRAFCLEFHHKEDKQTRAELKVRNYQAAYESGLWQAQWELETFPTVLPVFTEKIVGTGYLNTLRERRSDVTYLGKLLAGVLQNNLAEWANFATNEKSTILE